MTLKTNDHRVTAHVGVVALFQIVVVLITVGISWGIIRGDVQSISEWRKDHVISDTEFKKEYRDTTGELVRATTELKVTVTMLAEEVKELRKENKWQR